MEPSTNPSSTNSALPEPLSPHADVVRQMQRFGRIGWRRGWNLASSGGISVVVRRDPTELLITNGDSVKRNLRPEDFALINSASLLQETESPQSVPSVKCHCLIASQAAVGAVIQTYSVWTTILATRFAPLGGVLLEGYEMMKTLDDAKTPKHMEWLPILGDSNEPVPTEAQIQSALLTSPAPHALLLKQLGLFTWGKSLEDAYKKVEVFEFLCEVIVRQSQLS